MQQQFLVEFQKLRAKNEKLQKAEKEHTELQQRYTQLQQQTADQIRQLVDAAAAEKAELQAKFNEQLAAAQEQQRRATETLERTHERKAAEALEAHKGAVERERESHRREMEAAENLHRQAVDGLKASNADEVCRLQQQLDEAKRELDQTKQGYESEMAQVLNELQQLDLDPSHSAEQGGFISSTAVDRPSVGTSTDASYDAELKDLQRQLGGLQNRLTDAAAANDQLKQQVDKLGSQLRTERELNEKTKHNNQTELELAIRDAEMKTASLRSVKEQLQQKDDRLAAAGQETRRLRDELEGLRRRSVAEAGRLAEADRKLAEAEAKERQLQATIGQLTERLSVRAKDLDAGISEMKRREEQYHMRVCQEAEKRDEAEQRLHHQSQALELAQSSLSEQQERITQLEASLTSVQQQHETAISMAQELRHHVEVEQRRSSEGGAAMQQMRLENAKLRSRYSEVEHKVTQLLDQEHELQTQLDEASMRLQQSEGTLKLFQESMAANKEDFDKERREKEKLRADCARLQAGLNRQIAETAQQQHQLYQQPQQQQQQPQQQQQASGEAAGKFFNRHR